MTAPLCRLDARWTPDGDENGQLLLTLTNLGDAALTGFRLVYTSLTRNLDRSMVKNATFVKRDANYHEFAAPADLVLEPGAAWAFSVAALTRKPNHVTDGISTAYVVLADGSMYDIETSDLMPEGFAAEVPGVLVPEGELTDPIGLIPWPNSISIAAVGAAPAALFPAPGTAADAKTAFAEVAALAKRLFPNDHTGFSLAPITGGLTVSFETDAALEPEAYGLTFSEAGVRVASASARGRHFALISLAQMLRAAHADPRRFQFPRSGSIADAPRYKWRGCHLDVSRQVYSIESVSRFVDILAWNKMSVLHWHLTDDEGWRLEIKSRPELTRAGARKGPNEKMLPQLGSGASVSEGFYSQDEVRALIGQASRLFVDIMPEFDVPGHCTAVLAAYPELADPDERPGNYHSVQGYANNALNPALEVTYRFLQDVFEEVVGLFPFEYVHVGGDEVAEGSWLGSPRAQDLMARENLSGTAQLQAHLLGQVQQMLAGLGKKTAGWDEVSHGGGVAPEGTLLMAWQKAEIGPELAGMGYDVVMVPGEAYYLDMAQSEAWLEPGLTWAGVAPPQKTYEFEAVGDFPPELADKLRGVQGCIWSENLVSRQRFNHMVFPRLGAIAEAGWTQRANKSWPRFCAQAPMMPEL